MKKGVSGFRDIEAKNAVQGLARDEITGALVDPTRPLVWRRTVPLAPDFELRQGEAVFGEMEASNSTGLDAAGECLGQTLGLRLDTGLFRGIRIETVRASEEEGPMFRGPLWGWGRIRTTDGETLRWRHSFRGLYSHVLVDSRRNELLRMRPTFLRLGRTETRVTLNKAAWNRTDVAELLLLTWFLRAHSEARGRRVFKKSRKRFGGDFP